MSDRPRRLPVRKDVILKAGIVQKWSGFSSLVQMKRTWATKWATVKPQVLLLEDAGEGRGLSPTPTVVNLRVSTRISKHEGNQIYIAEDSNSVTWIKLPDEVDQHEWYERLREGQRFYEKVTMAAHESPKWREIQEALGRTTQAFHKLGLAENVTFEETEELRPLKILMEVSQEKGARINKGVEGIDMNVTKILELCSNRATYSAQTILRQTLILSGVLKKLVNEVSGITSTFFDEQAKTFASINEMQRANQAAVKRLNKVIYHRERRVQRLEQMITELSAKLDEPLGEVISAENDWAGSCSSSEDEFFDIAETESEEEIVDVVAVPVEHKKIDGETCYRDRLPVPRTEFKTSLWSVLKEAIGRDLSRVALPVTFNEPTSFLQRASEDFLYHDLLKAASFGGELFSKGEVGGSACYLAAWLISSYAAAVGRTYKPFNPLLGETYEVKHRGFFFIAEQTSHHPPGMAYYCEGEGWSCEGNMFVENAFTGKSLAVQVKGLFDVKLDQQDSSETWSFTRPQMSVDNIIFGQLKLEVFGQAVGWSDKGMNIVMEYQPTGWWRSAHERRVRGVVYHSSEGVPLFLIEGTWTSSLNVSRVTGYTGIRLGPLGLQRVEMARKGIIQAVDWSAIETAESRVLLEIEPRLPWSSQYYEFGQMTMELNQLTSDYEDLPPTDSRLRPDQRHLENGRAQHSNTVKRQLEDSQRERARDRGDEAQYRPMWFSKVVDPSSGMSFRYLGRYEDRDWGKCPHIFSLLRYN